MSQNMTPQEQYEASAWYAAVPAQPVQQPRPAAPVPAPERKGLTEKQKKRRRWTKVISMSVCGALLGLAVVVAVMSAIRAHRLVEQIEAGGPPEGGIAPPYNAADDEQQYYDDFREYFENYYTSSGEINLPAAPTGTGVTLSLNSKRDENLSLQEIYDLVSPAVVGINTYLDELEYGWGTGVVFTADGYIITNTHVIQGCDAAKVMFADGSEYEAMLVGADVASDIAVLYIEGEDLPYAEFGQSDELKVGDEAIAIGNPLGQAYTGTMTNGIISAIDRSIDYDGHSMTLLQTNAALNEGNSGGPLINACGQVIGITNMKIMNTYNAAVEGIGFAIPSSVVKQVADQLMETGIVPGEPTIGIIAGQVGEEAMALYGLPSGVYVTSVSEGSDALEKGMQAGDVITAVNGVTITSVAEINRIKEGLEVGDTIVLTIYRDGETFDLEIALVDKGDIQ